MFVLLYINNKKRQNLLKKYLYCRDLTCHGSLDTTWTFVILHDLNIKFYAQYILNAQVYMHSVHFAYVSHCWGH